MATTYTLISSVTVGSGGAASIAFSSIPATYTDLVVKISARVSGSAVTGLTLGFNGNSASSSMTNKDLQGDGSSAASGSGSIAYIGSINGTSSTASTFNNVEVYIPNYTSTSTYKSFSSDSVTENNGTLAYTNLDANLWSNNSAITSMTIDSSGNFVQYSTAYLYGISNA